MESQMEANQLTHWVTLGANFGVLIGLLLLVVELDQNRDMMRAQTRHQLAMGIVDINQKVAANEQLADILYRESSGGELTPRELFRWQMHFNGALRYWENVHYQYRVGLYDKVEFEKQLNAVRAGIGNSQHARQYWCQVREVFSPEFMAEMDQLLSPLNC